MKDYLILHRQIIHWEWHDDAYMLSLFIHLLCMANYVPNNKYRGEVQRVGELQTSVPQLAALTGMSQNTIISKLRKLQKTGEITVKPTKKGTNIYIRNYAKYQGITPDTTATNAVISDVQGGAQSGEQLAEHSAVPAGAQAGVQGENGQKSGKKHASSPCCSATVAPQGADNQIIYNSDSIIKEKNKEKKKGGTPVEGGEQQPTTAQLEAEFDLFRKAFKGTKRGLQVEFDNFKNKNANWREIIPSLMPALEREIAWRSQMQAAGQFVPQWAHLQTWINQHRWETEFEAVETAVAANSPIKPQPAQVQQPPKDDDYGGSFGGVDC